VGVPLAACCQAEAGQRTGGKPPVAPGGQAARGTGGQVQSAECSVQGAECCGQRRGERPLQKRRRIQTGALFAAHLHLLLPGFILVVFRVTGLFLTAPLLSSDVVRPRSRSASPAGGRCRLSPGRADGPADVTLTTALVGVTGELLIGLILGLAVSIVFGSGQLAGLMIGQQAGIALASVIDPTQDVETTAVGQVYVMVVSLVFLCVGGHRLLAGRCSTPSG